MITKLQSVNSEKLGKEEVSKGVTWTSLRNEKRIDFVGMLVAVGMGDTGKRCEGGVWIKGETVGTDSWD